MTTAQVILKVTPNELQIIDEALRLLHKVAMAKSLRKENLPEIYQLDFSIAGFDSHRLAIKAGEIIKNIGLKKDAA